MAELIHNEHIGTTQVRHSQGYLRTPVLTL